MYDYNEIKIETFETEEIPAPAKPEKTKKTRSGKGGFLKVLSAALAIAIVGSASGIGGAYAYDRLTADDSAVTVSFTPPSAPADRFNESNVTLMADTPADTTGAAAMLAAVRPSVVFITAKYGTSSPSGGTGIVMSTDGYIVTNAHVIQNEQQVADPSGSDGFSNPFSIFGFGGGFNFGGSYKTEVVDADEITVTFPASNGTDGEEYTAKIIGADTTTDLAVLKIDATGLTPATIGNSDKLRIGDACYSFGYPLGVGLTAADGIISGLDRNIGIEMQNGESQDIALIQTTAAINPGNSGGPLLDAYGNVVGITSAKIVSTQVEGFGFAIPITTAMPIISSLMTTGTYKSDKPVIGISGSNLNDTFARYYNLPVSAGVLVEAVTEGGAAEAAGIARGDIIIKADGTDITTMDELNAVKAKHKSGDTMVLTVARDSGNEDITLTLGSE
jgi:serine protease Do